MSTFFKYIFIILLAVPLWAFAINVIRGWTRTINEIGRRQKAAYEKEQERQRSRRHYE